jgi:hypothetical protein
MSNNSNHHVQQIHQFLADFFHSIKFVRAHWFPIVLKDCSSFFGLHGLASLMSFDYKDTYLPLMIASGLIVEQLVNTKGLGSKKRLVPSISKGFNWNDFFSEFGLTSMELSHAYVGKYKSYFVKVGHFHGRHFNIQDQLKGKVAGCGVRPRHYYGGCQEQQLKLLQCLATVRLSDYSTNATTLYLVITSPQWNPLMFFYHRHQ